MSLVQLFGSPRLLPVVNNRVVELLGKTVKNARPRTRWTLSKHVAAMFQNKLAKKELDRIIDLLFANKISGANNRLTYEF